jgi:hypothetical protein
MSEQRTIESVIVADIGSTLTHVCLIDLVDGVYRLIAHAEAPSTINGPENDITAGLRRAIKRLEQVAQRSFFDQEDDLLMPESNEGVGIDACVATSSAAPPLECAVIGLTDDLSVSSAQRGCAASNVLVTQTITLGVQDGRWNNEMLTALRQSPPDLILVVGGVDSGPTTPLEKIARMLATVFEDIAPERRPVMVFAGNQEARRPVATILSGLFDLRVVDNVRPNIHTESLGELQRELAQVYAQTKLAALPGYRRLRRWCTAPILSTSEALSRTLRFVAQRNDLSQGVLGVDVGGTTTYVGAARSEVYQWITGAAMGTSYGIHHLLNLSGIEAVRRWLPIAMDHDEVVSRLENARLRPRTIPQTMEDMLLMHAMVRQAMALTLQRMREQYWTQPNGDMPYGLIPAFDLVAVRGGTIAHTRQDGLIALTTLDAIQPAGLTQLVVDWASIWPQLGALAQVAPLAAAQVLERDGFRELGTVMAPIGEARPGRDTLGIKVTYENGDVIEMDIPGGEIRRLPLAPGKHATLEVQPSRHLDIGLGQVGLGGRARVRGGSLGIIIDARGRPLNLPTDEQSLQARQQQWLESLVHDGSSS